MEERPNVVVAVTGHRRIDPVLIPDLRLRVAGVLDGLCLRAGGAPRLCMLNALAVGADSLVFDIAVGKGIPVDAVLPLPPEEYEKDFAPGADGDGFRRRLGKARRVWVPERAVPRPECYAVLGRALLGSADTLLALWNGSMDGPPGGTASVIRAARARGAVLRSDPREGSKVSLECISMGPRREGCARHGLMSEGWRVAGEGRECR